MNLQQIKQIEDLLIGLGFTFDNRDVLEHTYVKKSDLYELIEGVWNLAIDTAADNAEVDFTCLVGEQEEMICEWINKGNLEFYVLKGEILKLKV